MKFGSAAAAIKMAHLSARSGLPSLEEVMRLMREFHERSPD